MKKLEGKVAVVTGASKGIGASIAKHLAAEGAAVVVNYASSQEGADRVVDEIVKEGGKAIAVQANVSQKAEIERLFAKTQQAFGNLDILVNNAGIYEFAPLEDITEEHFHKQFNLNVLGLILTSQEGIKPGMVETEGTHTAGITESEGRQQTEAQTPLGRIGQPQDIATAAVFLASSDSAWITGETLYVTGGFR
jgi:3-oxoacyl-[acyl-carrier protein] reductase